MVKQRERFPYPANKFVRFKAWVVEHAVLYGITEDPDCERALEILIESLDENIGKSIAGINTKRRKRQDSLAYIQNFKSRYLNAYDIEYASGIHAKEIVQVGRLIDSLKLKDIDVDSYLVWFFEEFLAKNEKMSPNINLSYSDKIVQNYMFENKDKIIARKQDMKNKKELEVLLNRAKILWRQTKREELKEALEQFKQGKISRYDFKEIVNKIDKESS